MKKIILIVCILINSYPVFCQDSEKVLVKGYGLTKEGAIQDALRVAVGQVAGVDLNSESIVKNFVLIKDHIGTKTSGCVTKYEVIGAPIPLSDGTYEVDVEAYVSKDAAKQNMKITEDLIGGIRFLVVYDERQYNSATNKYLKMVVRRINEYLISGKYNYIAQERFETLKTPVINSLNNDSSLIHFVQKMGLYAEASFIIYIQDFEIQSDENGTKVRFDVETYDNCTQAGLGPVVMYGPYSIIPSKDMAIEYSINEAIKANMARVLMFFSQTVVSWGNNGSQFLIRFYNMGDYSDLRNIKNKIQEDPNYGGGFEKLGIENNVSFRFYYKTPPDKLTDKILDLLDEDPYYKSKNIRDKFDYQRQMVFAPKEVIVPEAQEFEQIKAGEGKK